MYSAKRLHKDGITSDLWGGILLNKYSNLHSLEKTRGEKKEETPRVV